MYNINTHKVFVKMVLFALISLVALFSACGPKSNGNSSNYWYYVDTNEPPQFHTNDVERAAREIPFKLILPTNLPDNLDPHHPIEIIGPYKSNRDIVEIRILYVGIHINESNEFITRIPSSSTSQYLSVAGIEVLKEEIGLTEISSSGVRRIPCTNFSWNLDGIFFDVVVENTYSNDDALKIVESMINQ